MKRFYEEPEFDLTKFSFESILYIDKSGNEIPDPEDPRGNGEQPEGEL